MNQPVQNGRTRRKQLLGSLIPTCLGMKCAAMIRAYHLTLLIALFPLAVLATAARADDQRPNVVFIVVDDLNDLPLAPLGKPVIATPNIDRLAERGVSFTNAHTNDPICAPSRACMMFGLYPTINDLCGFRVIAIASR